MSQIAKTINLSYFISVILLKICIILWDPLLVIWDYTPRSIVLSYSICMQHTMDCHKRVVGVPTDHFSPSVVTQGLKWSPEIQAFLPEFHIQWPRQSKPDSVPKFCRAVNTWNIQYLLLHNKEGNSLPYCTLCVPGPKEHGTQTKVRGRIWNIYHIHLRLLFILQPRSVFRGMGFLNSTTWLGRRTTSVGIFSTFRLIWSDAPKCSLPVFCLIDRYEQRISSMVTIKNCK